MRRTASVIGLTGLALTAITARAADLSTVYKARPPLTPIYSWAGLYGGVNLGAVRDVGQIDPSFALEPIFFTDVTGGFSGAPGTLFLIPGTFPFPLDPGQSSRFEIMGGGQFGRNWQLAHWIYGVEADVDGSGASETFAETKSQIFTGAAPGNVVTRSLSGTWTADREWQASFRGRLGYSWDRWMAYGTAGVALTNVNMRTTYTAVATLNPGSTPIGSLAAGTTSYSDNHNLWGTTIGGGFEYAVTNAITVGGEYRYTHYSEMTFNSGATPAASLFQPTPPGPFALVLNTHQITVRMNFFFGRP